MKKWLKIKDKNVTFIKQKCLFMKKMNSIMDLWDMDKGKKNCEQKPVNIQSSTSSK